MIMELYMELCGIIIQTVNTCNNILKNHRLHIIVNN